MRLGAAWMALALATSSVAAAPTPLPVPANKAEAKAQYEAARTAYKANRYFEAARAYDAAHAYYKDATLLWNAARAWERSGELELAEKRFNDFLALPKVDAEQSREADEALVRIAQRLAQRASAKPGPERIAILQSDKAEAEAAGNAELAASLAAQIDDEQRRWDEAHVVVPPPPPPPPPARDRTMEWVLIGSGGAIAATGLVLGIVGQGELDDIDAAQDAARKNNNGVVASMTRAEAADQASSGKTLRTLGFVAGGIGLAAAATGLVALLLDDGPATDSHTTVGAAPMLDGGALVTIRGGF